MKFPCDTCKHNIDCYHDNRIFQTGYPGYEHFIIGLTRFCPLELSLTRNFAEGRLTESKVLLASGLLHESSHNKLAEVD